MAATLPAQTSNTAFAAPDAAQERPLVVIVTPVYNGGAYLEATMEAVQRQTWPNLLHILLNNSSTDNTAEIIDRYKNARHPIEVHQTEKLLPQVPNWNRAMRLVPQHANYVLFLCADDLIRRDAIELMVSRAEADKSVSVVTACDVVMDKVRAPIVPTGGDTMDGKEFIRAVCRNTHGHFAWQCFFIRWRPEDSVRDFFSLQMSGMDNDAVMGIAERGKVVFIDLPMIWTRHHAGQASAAINKVHNPKIRYWRWEACNKYTWLFDAAEAKRVQHAARRHLLQFQFYWRYKGATDAIEAVNKRLIEAGQRPTMLDYVDALIEWPFGKLVRSVAKFRANTKWPTISEAEFAAQ